MNILKTNLVHQDTKKKSSQKFTYKKILSKFFKPIIKVGLYIISALKYVSSHKLTFKKIIFKTKLSKYETCGIEKRTERGERTRGRSER